MSVDIQKKEEPNGENKEKRRRIKVRPAKQQVIEIAELCYTTHCGVHFIIAILTYTFVRSLVRSFACSLPFTRPLDLLSFRLYIASHHHLISSPRIENHHPTVAVCVDANEHVFFLLLLPRNENSSSHRNIEIVCHLKYILYGYTHTHTQFYGII